MSRQILNQKGDSLVQVLVALGIMSIIGMGLASMIVDQNTQVRALTEKLYTKEIESQLKSMFANSDYCDCVLRNKSFNTIPGSEGIIPSDQITRLKTGYSTGPTSPIPCTPSSTDYVPPVGTEFPGSAMTVKSIGLTNMLVLSPNTYTARINVVFDKSVRIMNGINVNVTFAIDPTQGTPASRPFLACAQGGGNGSGVSTLVYSPYAQNGLAVSCPIGYQMEICYTQVNSNDGQSLFYRNNISYLPAGNPTTCTSSDSDGSDPARLVGLCRLR